MALNGQLQGVREVGRNNDPLNNLRNESQGWVEFADYLPQPLACETGSLGRPAAEDRGVKPGSKAGPSLGQNQDASNQQPEGRFPALIHSCRRAY